MEANKRTITQPLPPKTSGVKNTLRTRKTEPAISLAHTDALQSTTYRIRTVDDVDIVVCSLSTSVYAPSCWPLSDHRQYHKMFCSNEQRVKHYSLSKKSKNLKGFLVKA